MNNHVSVIHLIVALSAAKLMLIHTYKSTDFEVHRNWLAVTHSLPLDRWYVQVRADNKSVTIDDPSPWTLDYPPLFAYFEYGLSLVARLADPAMLVTANLNYASTATVFFQQTTVVGCDLLLAVGLLVSYSSISRSQRIDDSRQLAAVLLVLANAGLIMVDHIHFQYNGLLLGVLLLAIGLMGHGRWLLSGFMFATLINMKHIYLYCAPPFFVYILFRHCVARNNFCTFVARLLAIAVVVLSVFLASFSPFISRGQLIQVLSRLFPFADRGLCHAYWAPNVWAVYNFADLVTARLSGTRSVGSLTGGLVENVNHTMLPSISPVMTALLTLATMTPVLVSLARSCLSASDGSRGLQLQFFRAVIVSNFCAFLFGWHVHEKAILLVSVPLNVLALFDRREARTSFLLNLTAHVSLLPLLYPTAEWPTKFSLLLFFTATNWHLVKQGVSLTYLQSVYITGLTFIVTILMANDFALAGHLASNRRPFFAVFNRYPFGANMACSVYTAIGMIYLWTCLYGHFWTARVL